MEHKVLEMRDIYKSYSFVSVLRDVSFSLNEGEILGLVGENGAGKSTLMKILSGGTQPDSGTVIIDGNEVEIDSPITAKQHRIAMVQQELSLISSLTVTDNIVLGTEYKRPFFKFLDYEKNKKYAQAALDTVKLSVPLNARISSLKVANQQMIEIARNIIREPRVLILDEPTTALTIIETEALLNQLLELKAKGISIIFISHKLEEVIKISDRIMIMRDGEKVSELKKNEASRDILIRHMVGDKEFFVKSASRSDEARKDNIVFEVKDFNKEGVFKNISFALNEGEILGFFGLKGAGRSETFHSIFGIDAKDSGEVLIEKETRNFRNPTDAINAGMGLVSEDRKFNGIFPDMDIKNNILLSDMKSVSTKAGFIRTIHMSRIAKELIKRLGIKTTSTEQHIKRLSGGNQQKVMISRWLHTNSKILVLDEPTKGVDVGAKQDIYKQIRSFSEEGKGVVVISSELEEVMLLSNRIAVMRSGEIQAILSGSDINAKTIMHYAAG